MLRPLCTVLMVALGLTCCNSPPSSTDILSIRAGVGIGEPHHGQISRQLSRIEAAGPGVGIIFDVGHVYHLMNSISAGFYPNSITLAERLSLMQLS